MQHIVEDGYFNIDAVQPSDYETLNSIGEWIWNRIEDFARGDVDNVQFFKDHILIESSYEDFCRGCSMGREKVAYKVPFGVFYSNQYAASWIEFEDTRIAEELKKNKELEKKEQQEKEAKLEMERELTELQRLTTKYKGAI